MILFLLSIWHIDSEFIDAVFSIRQLSLSIHWWFQGLRLLVFTGDLWISRDIAFLTIPFISHESIFAIDLMRRSWIYWRCWLHKMTVTQYSLTFSRSIVTLFSLEIYGSAVTQCFLQFHASAMTLLLLSIWCVGHEFTNAVDYIRRSHSVFIYDFRVYNYSVFAGVLWISRDIKFLTFPCGSHDSFFAIDLMLQLWILWRHWFHTSGVTQYSLTITRPTVTQFSLIYGSVLT